MNINDVQLFLAEARLSALVMFESGIYMQRELVGFQLPENLYAEAIQLCSALTKPKQELLPEIEDFEKLLASPAVDDKSWLDATNLILQWLWIDIPKINNLVKALETASTYQPECGQACLLIARSTDKVIDAINRTLTTAKRISGNSHGDRSNPTLN